MIPEVLFLALFCAAHVQGRPANSPHENPDRVVNTWTDVGNKDYVNNNFSPHESGNFNADVNGGHDVVIVGSLPKVPKIEATYQVATNINGNNIPALPRAASVAMDKIAPAIPVMKARPASLPIVNTINDMANAANVNVNFGAGKSEDGGDVNGSHKVGIVGSLPEVDKNVETHQEAANDKANHLSVHSAPSTVTKKTVDAQPAMQSRPANSPHENPNRVVNTWNDVGNTHYTNTNFSPNDSGTNNADVNAGHDVVMIGSSPEVSKKVETHEVATNNNANNIPVQHHASSTVTKEIVVARPEMQDRPASLPHENSERGESIVNTINGMGNTGNVNENLSADESKNGNDANGGHGVVIVWSPPEVHKNVETHQIATNNNANIPVHHSASSTVTKKIVVAGPVIQDQPASLPHENSEGNEPVVNTINHMGNRGNVNEHFSAHESENGNDVNGGHDVVIIVSPPEVNKKVETYEVATNNNANNIPVQNGASLKVKKKIVVAGPVIQDRPASLPHENSERDELIVKSKNSNDVNGGHDVVIVWSPPEIHTKVETYHTATNNDANIHVHHDASSTVTKEIVVAGPVTEQRTRKPPVEEFGDKFGHDLGDIVKDNVHNFGKEVESVFDVGKSVAGAAGTILDAKAKLIESVPRVKESFFGALG